MNLKEYKELKRKADDRYQQALEAAKAKHIEELKSIDIVWQMEHPPRTRHSSSTSSSEYGKLSKAIENSLQYVPDIFTKDDVRRAMKQIAPDIESKCKESSLTGRLIRLVKKGTIKQLEAGKGSSASKYQKLQEENNNDIQPDI